MSHISEKAEKLRAEYKQKFHSLPRGWYHGEETMHEYERYLETRIKMTTNDYIGKRIEIVDKDWHKYRGTITNYESEVDAGNKSNTGGNFFIDIEESDNPKVKKGQGWIFKENDLILIDILDNDTN